jgi:peptide deformylase
MSVSDIITLPNENLRKRSKKVAVIDQKILDLAGHMEQVTLEWEDSREHEVGVALASVQVDQLIRLVIVRNDFDNKNDRSFQVFINPEITKFEGEIVEDFEGCLSIKDIYGKVPRYSKVRVKALNLKGQEIRVKAEGFLARVFQHEIDHTNGIVFIDHIKKKKDAFYLLTKEGKLDPLNYDSEIKQNSILW